VRREAATWFARLQSGRDPGTERRFREWRDSDPRHSEAFDRISRTYDQAGLLRYSPSVLSGRGAPERQPKGRLRPALAAIATGAVLVPIGMLVVRSTGAPFGGAETVILMTSVGEIGKVELADGSKVTLDTATKVEVDVGRSHRSARLRYGRARFQVARASVPFEVETAIATVATSNGVVDVQQIGRKGRVEVLEGTADVRGPGRPQAPQLALGAGQSVRLGPSGAARSGAAAQASDWTRGMLQFDGTPLPQAIGLANRYSKRHIVLVGDLRGLRVTGAFRAGDTAGFSKALAAAFNLSLSQAQNGDLVLSKSAPPDPLE
jgi:transmembrane sensor